jgi:dihydrofolate synthase/folylpolyglutamate synthase
MNYNECITYLNQIPITQTEMSLEYIHNLLDLMGNPQNQLKVIQVAGTNGKGSTCRMLQTVLFEAGFKVGLFSSPALISMNEGIDLNGSWITNEAFTTSANKVIAVCRQLVARGMTHPTIYECLVVIGVDYFLSESVDIALFEVGMGGRLDGTNIFEKPLFSMITTIGQDHMAFLGNTISDIAFQKAGIIKAHCPVIIGHMPYEAFHVIEKEAKKRHAPIININHATTMHSSELVMMDSPEINAKLSEVGFCHPLAQKVNLDITFVIGSPIIDTQIGGSYALTLLGDRQIHNLSLVLVAINLLIKLGYHITDSDLKAGFAKVDWPCRQEYLILKKGAQQFNIIIDGAHNHDSMRALIQTIKDQFPDRKLITVFSALDDKDIPDMLSSLSEISSHIICTSINHARGIELESLKDMAKNAFRKVDIYEIPTDALAFAFENSNYDTVLLTGSLYLTVPARFNLLDYNTR